MKPPKHSYNTHGLSQKHEPRKKMKEQGKYRGSSRLPHNGNQHVLFLLFFFTLGLPEQWPLNTFPFLPRMPRSPLCFPLSITLFLKKKALHTSPLFRTASSFLQVLFPLLSPRELPLLKATLFFSDIPLPYAPFYCSCLISFQVGILSR